MVGVQGIKQGRGCTMSDGYIRTTRK